MPLDGSDPSIQAAKYAVKLAKMVKAEIIFMHAMVNPPYAESKSAELVVTHYIEEAKHHAEMWYMGVGDMASKEGVKFSTETILDVASAADSIVNMPGTKRLT